MDTLFDEILPDDHEVPASGIRSWLGSVQTAEQTGAVRLCWSPNEKLILHSHRGTWLSSRPYAAAGKELDGLEQAEAYEGSVFCRFVPLSAHGVIHSRILSHAEFHLRENPPRAQPDLGWRESTGRGSEPYLVKLKTSGASASILFNAVSNQPHSLYAGGGGILDQPGIPDPILRMRDDPLCVVSTFSSDGELDVWQEARLRMGFKRLTDNILERLEMLSGRVITYSFSRILAVHAASQNMDAAILQRQWINNEVFGSSREAAGKYRIIFRELLDHFSAVIGPRLLEANLREVFTALTGDVREILKFHEIVPEKYRL